MKAIAIIPARGGSKGIPGKNLRPVGGKPLLAWSIEQARQTPQISRIFVSTDSAEIAAVAREYGAEVIPRPSEISGDTASSESCLVHALDALQGARSEAPSGKGEAESAKSKEQSAAPASPLALSPLPLVSDHGPRTADHGPQTSLAREAGQLLHRADLRPLTSDLCNPDLVVFLQPTSPLREPDDIQKAIETLEREQADSLFSACRVEGFVWRVEKDGRVRSFSYDHLNRPRRQDAPEDLIENGSIYLFKPWVLRQFNNRLGGKIAVYRMPALNSFQIDEPADLELIEALLLFKQRAKSKVPSGKGQEPSAQGENSSSLCTSRFPLSALRPLTADLRSLSFDLCKIKLLVLDFDGVLTDNHVLVSQDGSESVYCSREDGLGLERLRGKGLEVLVLSKEKNPVVAARCRKLGLECIQGCDDKLAALRQRSEVRGLKSGEIGYVGNDVNDLECLRWVGLPIAVADAVPEVLAAAKWVTAKRGGQGAVREVCEALLAAKGEVQRAKS